MDDLNLKIKEFALANDFIHQSVIEKMEDVHHKFIKKEYDDLNNKFYVCINKIKHNFFFIVFGKISVEMDILEEQEFYWINKNILFSLPFLPESISLEEFINNLIIKCKEYI